MTFTILGASGFVGSHLARAFEAERVSYWAPGRDEDLLARSLGHVLYCIGVTADFRARPYDTVRAHACQLLDILERANFDSFLYLSTTRLYGKIDETHETATFRVNPLDPSDLYNLSKLMGESVCLTANRPNVRVARLSNVFGNDFASPNFLSSIVRDAVEDGHVLLRTTMASAKDYVSINDVVALLPQITQYGRERIYNVASGINTTNGALLAVIAQHTGCTATVADAAETIVFPPITVDRIRDEFAAAPISVLQSLGTLIAAYRSEGTNR
jgi:nucleoside-diphosphate-sugar epimerase